MNYTTGKIPKYLKIGILILLLSCVMMSSSCGIKMQPGINELYMKHDDERRYYKVYIPEDLPENASLVFGLHAFTGSNDSVIRSLGMNDLATPSLCRMAASGMTCCLRYFGAGGLLSTSDVVGSAYIKVPLCSHLRSYIDVIWAMARLLRVPWHETKKSPAIRHRPDWRL